MYLETTITREIPVLVQYTVQKGAPAILMGKPENCSPGEPDEVEIIEVTNRGGADKLNLTSEEEEQLRQQILEEI